MAETSEHTVSEPLVSERILRSAERIFRTYGYSKTTVADIAEAAGISTAYVYRFYPSKLALAEAVSAGIMSRNTAMLWQEAKSTLAPADKIRRIYVRLTEEALRLLFEEERLLDMVRVGMDKNWLSVTEFKVALIDIVRHVISEGVDIGRFRKVENVDQTARAVGATLMLCTHPVLLQEELKNDPVGRARDMASLVVDALKSI